MEMKLAKGFLVESCAIVLSKLMSNKLESIVRIEGGLGSQLIGLLTYESKRMNSPKTRADVSYFIKQDSEVNASGVSVWNWELDKYGYNLDDFREQSKFYDKFLGVINSKNSNKAKDFINKSRRIPWREYAEKLPIAASLNDYLKNFELTPQDNFSVIHVRQGDYLKVSSRILKLEEAVDIFKHFLADSNEPIFVTSDGSLSDDDLKYCKESFSEIPFIIVESRMDLHLVHGLMRSARLLVTSNSTFSWTAGMLSIRKSPLVISPTSFFGNIDDPINNFFRATSSWMVLEVD